MSSNILNQIAHDGFGLITKVLEPSEVEHIRAELRRVLNRKDAAVIEREGKVVGARNLLQVWPELAAVWRRQHLLALLAEILGPRFGLVRAL